METTTTTTSEAPIKQLSIMDFKTNDNTRREAIKLYKEHIKNNQ